jgi:hypothetical protein
MDHVAHRRFGGPGSQASSDSGQRIHVYFYVAGEGKRELAEVLLEVARNHEYVSVTLAYHPAFVLGDDADLLGWAQSAAELDLGDEDDEGGYSITMQTFHALGLIASDGTPLTTANKMTDADRQYVTFDNLKLEALDGGDQQQRGIFVVMTDGKRIRILKKCAQFVKDDDRHRLLDQRKATDAMYADAEEDHLVLRDDVAEDCPADMSGRGSQHAPFPGSRIPRPVSEPVPAELPPASPPRAAPGSWWAGRGPYTAPHNDLVFILTVPTDRSLACASNLQLRTTHRTFHWTQRSVTLDTRALKRLRRATTSGTGC